MNFIKFFVVPLLALSLSATAMQQDPTIMAEYKLESDAYGHLWIISNFYKNGAFLKRETISAWKNEEGLNEYFGFTTETKPLDVQYIKGRMIFYTNGHLKSTNPDVREKGLILAAQVNDEETDKKIAADNKKKTQEKLTEPTSGLTIEQQAYAEVLYERLLENSIKQDFRIAIENSVQN